MATKQSSLWDAVIGAVLTLLVLGAYFVGLPLFESVELKLYDMRSKLRVNLAAADEIALVAIDDDSLAQIGRWPWPRWRLAALVDKLSAAGAKVIGLDIVLSEEEYNPGLGEIKRLQDSYRGLLASRAVTDKKAVFDAEFSSAMVNLDSDSKLESSLRESGRVVLPMMFAPGGKLGAKPEELPAEVSSFTVSYQAVQGGPQLESEEGVKATCPVLRFTAASAGIGHVRLSQDFDGVLRRERPVFRYGDSYYPSYALALILAYSGLRPSDAVFSPGQSVSIDKLSIPLDAESRMLVTYNGPEGTFNSFAYQDVMNDKVSPEAFKGKIVVVGPTALGVGTTFVTPLAINFPSIELIANIIENILHRKFLMRPPWAAKFELGLLGLVGLFIMFLLPRLRALSGFVFSLMLLVGMLMGGVYFFVNGQWVKVAYPSVLLTLAYLVVISKRFFVTEKGKELVEASAIETNKMLGLSFQGQGMLDMAFEKFRLCPLDDNMKDTLYNLALDFERKRQFAKASAVLGHIEAKDPKYKDVAEKSKMLRAAADGAVFGGVGGAKKDGTVMITGGSTKPTLGRYEIEKELGRGAMGIVYLGRDPKINRQVAIKTMVLEEGSDAASTKEGLLPVVQAMEYVAIVADALDYAHAQGIVHRDIKPANFMLLKDGTVRVADFGIARITASSKTATGPVMGTPSYMSPEQVAGKRVDGRSDLFSLSVALYELLTGEKPFKGGEGIGTLLFQIANDPHPDPLTIRPDLPPCVAPVINKGLAKDADQRYARGSLLAADLRACIAAVKSGTTAEITQPVAKPPAAEGTVRLEAPPPAQAPALASAPPAAVLPEPVLAVPEPTLPSGSGELPPSGDGGPLPAALERAPLLPDPAPEPVPAPAEPAPPAGLELGAKSPFGPPADPAPSVPASDKTVRLPPVRSGEFPDAAAAPPPTNPDATIRLAPDQEKKP
ncbi:MAG: CHASE2 domain-containing protein [Elusimicrobia bacterium]|nr:CHASE2 domain-containing protein [Elusimicrobiota bacterium]